LNTVPQLPNGISKRVLSNRGEKVSNGRRVLKELRAIDECLGVALSSCDASKYKINLRIHKTREIVIWEKLLSTGFVDRIEKKLNP